MLVTYDPLDQVEPYEIYRQLRTRSPVYRNEERGFWALSRFDDVQWAAREWRRFSSAEGVNLDDTVSLGRAGSFISADPPDHDRLRKAVRGRFTPAGVGAMETAIRADVCQTLAEAVRQGGFDGAAVLAWAIPIRTISRLLGLPVEDEAMLRTWLHAIIYRDREQVELPPEARAAADGLREYFLTHVKQRRGNRCDDLLSDVVAAAGSGELQPAEIPGLCILLYVAGTETVADFIGNALAVLANHPDQRAILGDDAAPWPAAIEELLRFESPVQHQVRTATADTELHGVTIPAGARVVLLWGAANRDEGRWERPDELDLTRETRRNLAFGEGIHHCLGAPLARLQGRVVLEELLRMMPNYRLAGSIERVPTHNTRGVKRLPLTVG